jgi:hypothetical protein
MLIGQLSLAEMGGAGAFGDRVVEGVGKSGVQSRVQRGQPQYGVGGRAVAVVGAFQANDALRQRAGFVGAQHIHAAEVFDGLEPTH